MALKDWKNIRNMKVVITWKNQDKLLEMFNEYGGWTVTKYDESGAKLKRGIRKGFNTKTKALAFAKFYMRKH